MRVVIPHKGQPTNKVSVVLGEEHTKLEDTQKVKEIMETTDIPIVDSQIALFNAEAEKVLPVSERPRARMESPEAPWVFQEFPSHFVPYDGHRFFVRPLDWELLGRLHAIRLKKNPNSFSQMLDVFNNCVKGIDIRDLTMGDFYSFMYWLRINSYPKTPFSMEYTSKYGGGERKIYVRMNKAERDAKVEQAEKAKRPTKDKNWHDLEIVELEMSVEQYAYWKQKGIRFPTVRDFELLSVEPIAEEEKYISTFAQYVVVDKAELTEDNYFQKHMSTLKEFGLSFITEIDDFATQIKHGVVEKIGVTISDLNRQLYVDRLIRQRDIFHNIVMTALDDPDSDKAQIAIVTSNLVELNNEIDRVQHAIDTNTTIQPEEEEVRITINLDSFFPIL